MNFKKIILTSLISTSLLNGIDSNSLENSIRNRDLNLELQIHKKAQEYIKMQEMSENDRKYPFHRDFKKFEKNIKENIKNLGFEGGHQKGEYYAISQNCFFNSICYGASINTSKNAPKIIFRIK